MDAKIADKLEELRQIKGKLDELAPFEEMNSGDKLSFNTPQESAEIMELSAMEDLARAQLALLEYERMPAIDAKPLTLKDNIQKLKAQLEELREQTVREGYELTKFKYTPQSI